MNSPYFGMNRAYFGEIQGGSRNSGFIQRMLAERPEDFEINAIENPSAYLRARFSKPIASAPAPSEPPRRKRTIIRLGKPAPSAPAMKKPDMALYGTYHSTLKSGKNKTQVAQFEKLYHDWLLVNDKEYREKK
jgi:hypothetical protein